MLPIPTSTTGLGYEEVDETSVYADWVECSALFHGEPISKADVQDCFTEINSFDKEKTPSTMADIWSELERRKRLLGQCYPVSINGSRITAMDWKDYAAYSFCLLLSYSKSNQEWEQNFCTDYPTQGALFERVSVAALKHLLKNWEVRLTGWSKENPTLIKSQIKSIAAELGEPIGQATPRSVDKDGGVDVLCYRQFPDKRGNYPVILVQCATGRNWTAKLGLDFLNLWANWIYFKARNVLSRGFAVPFAFGDETFRQTQMHGNCLILDRIRLFSHDVPEPNWLPEDLSTEIKTWVTQKINTLPEE